VPRLQRVGKNSASTTIRVTTQSDAPVTLIISWYDASSGRQDGPSETVQLSGRTKYTITRRHTFQDEACSEWEVRVNTSPSGTTASQRTPRDDCKQR
jgi:uncharacterized protein YcfL